MEAGIKLAVFGVVALAFLIGGVSGFTPQTIDQIILDQDHRVSAQLAEKYR